MKNGLCVLTKVYSRVRETIWVLISDLRGKGAALEDLKIQELTFAKGGSTWVIAEGGYATRKREAYTDRLVQ